MTTSDANSTRASLEVARVALGRMMGAPPAPGAPRTLPMTMATRANEAWKSAEILLRAATGRADLAGQALLTEARRIDALDMDGMHALVAMREWVERTLAPGSAAQMLTLPPTDAEREVAANALAALERSVGGVADVQNSDATASGSSSASSSSIPAQPSSGSPSQWAPQPSGDPTRKSDLNAQPGNTWAPPAGRVVPPIHDPRDELNNSRNNGIDHRSDDKRRPFMSSGAIMFIAFVVVASVSIATFMYLRARPAGTSSSLTDAGAAMYASGARENAQVSFLKAVEENPNDARALTYLGRIARENGSLTTARQYLENAVRADPNNALALREFASALLADNQYELARRFYVRALTVDATDRTSQGFLGCTLLKLNRTDEAQRWMDRAGRGEWSNCATPTGVSPNKD